MTIAHAGCPENSSGSVVFLLLGFERLPALMPFLFVFFLNIYMLTIAGNILILFTVASDVHLHSPMYFFLGNLSILEVCYTTAIIPTLLGSHLGQGLSISHYGCIIQLGIFGWFIATECFLLTVMAYDRYVAICHPLHYSTMMDLQICIHLAVDTWVIGFFCSFVNSTLMFMLQFPDYNFLDHFMCDFSPLLTAACSDTSQIQLEAFFFSIITLFVPFILLIVSYAYIISTILKIPSTKGKNKAFSTCSSHLIIVISYFAMLMLMYMAPSASNNHSTNKAFSLIYTVGTPLFNPIVYTLRNKEMKQALKKSLSEVWCIKII